VEGIYKLEPLFTISGDNRMKLQKLRNILQNTSSGLSGIEEAEQLLILLESLPLRAEIEQDISLARD